MAIDNRPSARMYAHLYFDEGTPGEDPIPLELVQGYMEGRLEELGLEVSRAELSKVMGSLESQQSVTHHQLEDVIESIISGHSSVQIKGEQMPQDPEPVGEEDAPLEGDPSFNLIQFYLQEAGRYKVLSPEKELQMARKIKDPATPAAERDRVRNTFAQHNLRLVISVAGGYAKKNRQAFLEFIQEGNEGLLRAIEKFDPELGFKFSTYAIWWIRQYIARYRMENPGSIRLPIYLVEMKEKMERYAGAFRQEHGRDPSMQEISRDVHIPAPAVRLIMNIRQPLSLDKTIDGSDESATLGDYVKTAGPGGQRLKGLAVKELLARELSQRERVVLCLRYGLFDHLSQDDLTSFCGPDVSFETLRTYEQCAITGGLTLKRIGELHRGSGNHGKTRERIRQIEEKAIGRLRHPSRARRIYDFYAEDRADVGLL